MKTCSASVCKSRQNDKSLPATQKEILDCSYARVSAIVKLMSAFHWIAQRPGCDIFADARSTWNAWDKPLGATVQRSTAVKKQSSVQTELLEECKGAAACRDARPSSGTRSQGGFRGSRPDWLELRCTKAAQGVLQGPHVRKAWLQNPAMSAADPDTVLGSKVRPVQVAIPFVDPLTNATAV